MSHSILPSIPYWAMRLTLMNRENNYYLMKTLYLNYVWSDLKVKHIKCYRFINQHMLVIGLSYFHSLNFH